MREEEAIIIFSVYELFQPAVEMNKNASKLYYLLFFHCPEQCIYENVQPGSMTFAIICVGVFE